MANEVRCFHSHPPEGGSRLTEATEQRGIVVCVHPYGVGVYMLSLDAFGHVDATMMGVGTASKLDDYPSVGSVLSLTLLSYSGTGQLRLSASA